VVIKNFPNAQGLAKNHEEYLNSVDQIYLTDSYHSLSIKRYAVSLGLIVKVKSGNWNIEENIEDRNHQDAMAARGYWQATQSINKRKY